jgi:hypothetical protein
MHNIDIDTALESLVDAKAAKQKIEYCLKEIEKLRHKKPVEKLYVKPPMATPKDEIRRVIIPDSHGNMINRHAAAALVRDIKLIQPDEVVWLGDHLDCGGFLAQNQVLGYVAEAAQTGFYEDVEAANLFFDQVISAAPSADHHYLLGNHEDRIERWCVNESLRRHTDAEFLYSLIGPEAVLKTRERGMKVYRRSVRYHDLPIEGCIRLGECLFTHGWSTSKAAATAHAAKAGMCVVYGHTHRAQSDIIRTVAGGSFGAWCPGSIAQLQSYYEHGDPNNHSHGYGLQLVASSGKFLHLNIPIINGDSFLHGLDFNKAA